MASACPGSSEQKAELILDKTPYLHRVYSHSHTHSDQDNVDMQIYHTCTHLWDVEGNEVPGENPCRYGETYKLHTGSGPSQESNIFFLIDIIINRHWKKWHSKTCCDTTLLEDFFWPSKQKKHLPIDWWTKRKHLSRISKTEFTFDV